MIILFKANGYKGFVNFLTMQQMVCRGYFSHLADGCHGNGPETELYCDHCF